MTLHDTLTFLKPISKTVTQSLAQRWDRFWLLLMLDCVSMTRFWSIHIWKPTELTFWVTFRWYLILRCFNPFLNSSCKSFLNRVSNPSWARSPRWASHRWIWPFTSCWCIKINHASTWRWALPAYYRSTWSPRQHVQLLLVIDQVIIAQDFH